MRRLTGTEPNKTRDGASADKHRTTPPKRHSEENRSHLLEAQAESGRQMRVFIREHYGDAE